MEDPSPEFITDPGAREVLRQMLAAIVDHPEIHRNLFKYQRMVDGSFEYFVGMHRSGPSWFPRGTRLPINIVDRLVIEG